MRIIVTGMIALSVMAGIAAPADAKKSRVSDTQTTWHPVDPSSSIH
jgi:hypothetical protein